VFRHVFRFDHFILRATLYALIATALFLLTTTVAGATDTAPTPTAGEYALETKPATARQPEASTSADLRLASGLSIVAVMVMALVVVSERRATAIDNEQATPAPKRPAVVRSIGSAEAMPEAA
jgi:hypothetical protein